LGQHPGLHLGCSAHADDHSGTHYDAADDHYDGAHDDGSDDHDDHASANDHYHDDAAHHDHHSTDDHYHDDAAAHHDDHRSAVPAVVRCRREGVVRSGEREARRSRSGIAGGDLCPD